MKNYDEITSSVLQKAAIRAVKIKRIRYTCTLTAVCSACIIGGAAFMKLDKPELMPSESQTDTVSSASDPSTDIPEETTTKTSATTRTTTQSSATTMPKTETSITTIVTAAATSQPEIVTVYTSASSSVLVTSIPGNTHAASTVSTTTIRKETTAFSRTTAKQTEATLPATTSAAAAATSMTSEAETFFIDTAETFTETIPTEPPSTFTASFSETVCTTTRQSTKKDFWNLMYELYLQDQLPFYLETTTTAVTTTETTTQPASDASDPETRTETVSEAQLS